MSIEKFDAKFATMPFESGSELKLQDATAVIPVMGVLTKSPDFMSAFFGGGNTTYSAIADQIIHAESDPSVKDNILLIDSPGGTVAGMFELLDVIKSAKKPIRAVVSGTAASAAYAVAAVCDSIEVSCRGDRLGNLGVVLESRNDPDKITLTSSNAPNKRPDLSTPEGKEAKLNEINALEDLFVEYIAEGRNIPQSELMAKFGNGSVFLADEAIERGMADGFHTETPNTNSNPGDNSMDAKQIEELRLAAIEEGKALGSAEAMGRVNAHLHMAEKTGANDVAFEAIKAGVGLTDEYQAQYLTAGIAKAVAGQTDEAAAAVAAQAAGVRNTDTTDAAKETKAAAEEASADAVIEELEMAGSF